MREQPFENAQNPMRTRLISLAVIVAVHAAEVHGAPALLTLARADASIVFQTK
jgi:hypothetical protein